MIRKLGMIALAVIILMSSAAGASAATGLIYSEDFSGYAVDSFPSGWSIVSSGAGNSEQKIADDAGNKVLLAKSQAGVSAVLRYALGALPGKIIFSFDASIPGGGSVSISNGTLAASVSGAPADQWASYTLTINFSQKTYDLSINGATVKSRAGLSATSASTGITLNTGHATGNDIAMIDNLVIQETYAYYSHNTVCSFGPHFRDVSPELTDKWYMFTPVDLSRDGTQTYPLVGGGAYIIGQVNIYVSGDNVTVLYQYFNDDIWDEQQFFTIFPDYGSITTVTPEEIEPLFSYGQPISIAYDLSGDTNVILFVRNVVTFRDDNPKIVRFWENIPEYKTQREQMLDLLDGTQGY
ncbi:MAG: hypothetical protein JW811_02925 [Clostridiales bacterium]|nr:hypothetical protein [Clostridiales bacterium]